VHQVVRPKLAQLNDRSKVIKMSHMKRPTQQVTLFDLNIQLRVVIHLHRSTLTIADPTPQHPYQFVLGYS
jgi:hypothetical protein